MTEKLWSIASLFKGIKSGRLRSSPLGWDGEEILPDQTNQE
ncbi:hypothetical protein [Okeania sp. SIO1I7]|nr:hypothetical protein [Okeania sp. SIO1I7]